MCDLMTDSYFYCRGQPVPADGAISPFEDETQRKLCFGPGSLKLTVSRKVWDGEPSVENIDLEERDGDEEDGDEEDGDEEGAAELLNFEHEGDSVLETGPAFPACPGKIC